MITDLLFYTISAVQIYYLIWIALFIYGVIKASKYLNSSELAEKNVKSFLRQIILNAIKLILITTVKPYFLAMIGGLL